MLRRSLEIGIGIVIGQLTTAVIAHALGRAAVKKNGAQAKEMIRELHRLAEKFEGREENNGDGPGQYL